MRKLILAMMAVTAAGMAGVATSTPAAAHEYPWCAQGWGLGIPGDCSYSSYAQCVASASGRDLSCNVNPRVAFDRQAPRSRQPRAYPYDNR